MISRLIWGIAAMAFAVVAHAFTPRTGHWNNLSENGSGYNIDIQNGVLVITVYSYQQSGAPQWYIASGPMTNDQHTFSGTLLKLTGGQCISCAYNGLPALAGNDGPISINFTSETSAVLTLPGARTTTIHPFNFGFGDPPQGLHGEWVYVETIGNLYFVDHYTFATDIGPTANGSGVVLDITGTAACELQTTGTLAGFVFCAHWTDTSLATVADQYVYLFGLDKTFAGVWVSPTTFNQYTMKGQLWASAGGFPTNAQVLATPSDILETTQRKLAADKPGTNVGQDVQLRDTITSLADEFRVRALSLNRDTVR